MTRFNRLQGAAIAALLLTTPLVAQQQPPRSVTLVEAIRLSEQTQPAVIAAQGTIHVDEAIIRARKGAFLPSLSFSAGGNRSFSSGPSRLEPSSGLLISGDRTSQSVNFGASSSLTLFDGFRRNRDLSSAKANLSSADASLVNERAQNSLSVTGAFFDALAARQVLLVDSASVVSAAEQLRVAVAKLRAGSAALSDSLSALVTLANARFTLSQAKATVVTTEAILGHLVGFEGRVAATDDSAYYRGMASLDTTAIRNEAMSSSPQIRSLVANVAAARASYASSKSSYYPTLGLGLNASYAGNQADSNYILRASRGLSLSLSWPIFNGFTREQQIEAASINVDNANAQLADERRQIAASVTQQFAALSSAQEQVDVSRVAADAAVANLRVVAARYGAGAGTIVDVDQAQVQLTQAQVNQVTARFAYLRAKAEIEALIGRSL